MTLADLAGYQPKKRAPICHDYRAQNKDYRICGFPPPSSGAIAVGQILGILAGTNALATLPLQDRACLPPIGCTCTPKRRAWLLPTAASTWAIPISCNRRPATG